MFLVFLTKAFVNKQRKEGNSLVYHNT